MASGSSGQGPSRGGGGGGKTAVEWFPALPASRMDGVRPKNFHRGAKYVGKQYFGPHRHKPVRVELYDIDFENSYVVGSIILSHVNGVFLREVKFTGEIIDGKKYFFRAGPEYKIDTKTERRYWSAPFLGQYEHYIKQAIGQTFEDEGVDSLNYAQMMEDTQAVFMRWLPTYKYNETCTNDDECLYAVVDKRSGKLNALVYEGAAFQEPLTTLGGWSITANYKEERSYGVWELR